jgi:hypothetical protein
MAAAMSVVMIAVVPTVTAVAVPVAAIMSPAASIARSVGPLAKLQVLATHLQGAGYKQGPVGDPRARDFDAISHRGQKTLPLKKARWAQTDLGSRSAILQPDVEVIVG